MTGKGARKRKTALDDSKGNKSSGSRKNVDTVWSCGDLTNLVEMSPIFMCISDPHTYELLYINKAMSDAYGGAVPGMKCYAAFEDRESPCPNCMNDIILKTRMPHTWDYFEVKIRRHCLTTAHIIKWRDGRDVRFETTLDITDQKKIEAMFRSSEEKYKTLIEKSTYGYFMLNTKGEIVYINDVAAKLMYGKSSDELKGQRIELSDVLKNADLETASANLEKLKNGYKFENPREYTITRANGTQFLTEVQTFPIWKDGKLDGYQGTIVDITSRVAAQRELKEKSEFLDAVFNNTSDGIFVLDEDLRYVMINPASGKILHHDPEQWIGKKAGQFKHPEDMKMAAEAIMKVANGESASTDIRVQAADGQYHLLNIRYNPMFLGEQFHILGMVTDITERKSAELALKASEEKYRAFYNQAADGIILMPIDQKTLTVNEAFARMHGYSSPKEMEALGLEDLDTPESAKLAPERLRRLIAGEELTFEVEHYHKDGHAFPVLVRCKVFDIDGVPHYMGFHQDITERKKAEQALIASEEKYRSLFDNSPEAILILGSDVKINECNKATVGLLEMGTKDIIGKRIDQLGILDSAQSELHRRVFISMTKGKEMNVREMELIFKGGRSKWIEIIPSMISRAGEFYGIQVIARDITDRKLTENEMRKKLLKFDIESGNLYLAKESRASQSLEAFKELLMVGNEGLIVSRESRAEYQGYIDYMFNHVTVSETGKEYNVRPDYNALRQLVSNVPRRHVILIDCIEYLISQIGVKKTLAFIHYLKDIAVAKGLVVLMSIDPSAITEKDLRLIEKECVEMHPCQSMTSISDKLLDILKYIDDMNKEDTLPSYSDISEYFNISKPTARKRISQLNDLGTVKEIARGRMKLLEVTKEGKHYLVV